MNSMTLRFVESEPGERYSLYRDIDGEFVYLEHGTRRELIDEDTVWRDLHDLWKKYLDGAHPSWRHIDGFRAHIEDLCIDEGIGDEISFCGDCSIPNHEDDTHFTNDCSSSVCGECIRSYTECGRCDERYRYTTTTGTGIEVCEHCRDNHYTYCEHCEEYFPDGEHYCTNADCDCESSATAFAIRNQQEWLFADRLTTVTLPEGIISEEGLDAIRSILNDAAYSHSANDYERQQHFWRTAGAMHQLGNEWQTRQGNFTRRLSKLAYSLEYAPDPYRPDAKVKQGLKLPPEVISQVGNVAREHSGGVDFEVSVTRLLNGSPEEFAHEGSCWWTDHSESRCALKTNGGFGLRSWSKDVGYGSYCTGRAWVMPLRSRTDAFGQPGFTPTYDTQFPDAFVVFNGYEDLEGFTGARILAHMTGLTYRRISFGCSPMYVNDSYGYLVGAEDVVEPFTDGRLHLDVSQHSQLFHREVLPAMPITTTYSEELANV